MKYNISKYFAYVHMKIDVTCHAFLVQKRKKLFQLWRIPTTANYSEQEKTAIIVVNPYVLG